MGANPSRRSFLKTAALASAYFSGAGSATRQALASGIGQVSEDWMGVLVDLTKCNGCRQCEAACQEAAGFPVPTKEELLDESVFNRRRPLGPRSYTTVNRIQAGRNDAENRPADGKITHKYSDGGSKVVTLSVTGPLGDSTANKTVEVTGGEGWFQLWMAIVAGVLVVAVIALLVLRQRMAKKATAAAPAEDKK